ncbi:hypothetical protein CN902_11575 [Priestia megaterium]|nr:hypothetical protein CN902_11575 [Priestia megaterium]
MIENSTRSDFFIGRVSVGFLYVAVSHFFVLHMYKGGNKKEKENTYAKTANKRNHVLNRYVYDWKCGSLFR